MLVWRLNLAWKSGHPNQCLRLGDDAKTNRTIRARFHESASYSSPLSARAKTVLSLCTLPYTSFDALVAEATINRPRARLTNCACFRCVARATGSLSQRSPRARARPAEIGKAFSMIHTRARSGIKKDCFKRPQFRKRTHPRQSCDTMQ